MLGHADDYEVALFRLARVVIQCDERADENQVYSNVLILAASKVIGREVREN